MQPVRGGRLRSLTVGLPYALHERLQRERRHLLQWRAIIGDVAVTQCTSGTSGCARQRTNTKLQ